MGADILLISAKSIPWREIMRLARLDVAIEALGRQETFQKRAAGIAASLAERCLEVWNRRGATHSGSWISRSAIDLFLCLGNPEECGIYAVQRGIDERYPYLRTHHLHDCEPDGVHRVANVMVHESDFPHAMPYALVPQVAQLESL